MSGEYLGKGAIVAVGVGVYTGRQLRAVFLEEYDQSSDSYVGVTHFQDDEFTRTFKNVGKGQFAEGRTVNVAAPIRITGLRHYPCADRPNYAFQFVLPGEDASPLRDIAAANAEGQYTTGPIEQPPVEAAPEPQQQQNDTRPMWQQLGFASKGEWRAAGSPSR